MPSFKQLMGSYGTMLVLDAASATVQTGIYSTGSARWTSADGEASVALFAALNALGGDIEAVDAFVYCDGPGSILGIRNVAMALRTWSLLRNRPVFGYSSLELVAAARGEPELTVIADARRESWHTCKLGIPLRRVATDQLAGPLAMPSGFRHWTPLPASVALVPYNVCALLAAAGSAELFREHVAPDAFLHEEPSYVTWEPQIHRAPASR